MHVWSKSNTIPQTIYNDYNAYNDHNDYDHLREHVSLTIKMAIDKSNTTGNCGQKCSINIYSAHMVHEVHIADRNGEMQCVRAFIDCGAIYIII